MDLYGGSRRGFSNTCPKLLFFASVFLLASRIHPQLYSPPHDGFGHIVSVSDTLCLALVGHSDAIVLFPIVEDIPVPRKENNEAWFRESRAELS